jgi:hypothetical protein
VEELAYVGVRTINNLRSLLLQGQQDAEQSEQRNPPTDEEENVVRYTDVGIARESMEYALPAYGDARHSGVFSRFSAGT